MKPRDKYYIKLAEVVHQAVVNWDPLGLISDGSPEDEYDTIEKRFLSGIINSKSDEDIIKKVKENLEYFGVNFEEIGASREKELDTKIFDILVKLKKHNANTV